jgi:hypothetical protein
LPPIGPPFPIVVVVTVLFAGRREPTMENKLALTAAISDLPQEVASC